MKRMLPALTCLAGCSISPAEPPTSSEAPTDAPALQRDADWFTFRISTLAPTVEDDSTVTYRLTWERWDEEGWEDPVGYHVAAFRTSVRRDTLYTAHLGEEARETTFSLPRKAMGSYWFRVGFTVPIDTYGTRLTHYSDTKVAYARHIESVQVNDCRPRVSGFRGRAVSEDVNELTWNRPADPRDESCGFDGYVISAYTGPTEKLVATRGVAKDEPRVWQHHTTAESTIYEIQTVKNGTPPSQNGPVSRITVRNTVDDRTPIRPPSEVWYNLLAGGDSIQLFWARIFPAPPNRRSREYAVEQEVNGRRWTTLADPAGAADTLNYWSYSFGILRDTTYRWRVRGKWIPHADSASVQDTITGPPSAETNSYMLASRDTTPRLQPPSRPPRDCRDSGSGSDLLCEPPGDPVPTVTQTATRVSVAWGQPAEKGKNHLGRAFSSVSIVHDSTQVCELANDSALSPVCTAPVTTSRSFSVNWSSSSAAEIGYEVRFYAHARNGNPDRTYADPAWCRGTPTTGSPDCAARVNYGRSGNSVNSSPHRAGNEPHDLPLATATLFRSEATVAPPTVEPPQPPTGVVTEASTSVSVTWTAPSGARVTDQRWRAIPARAKAAGGFEDFPADSLTGTGSRFSRTSWPDSVDRYFVRFDAKSIQGSVRSERASELAHLDKPVTRNDRAPTGVNLRAGWLAVDEGSGSYARALQLRWNAVTPANAPHPIRCRPLSSDLCVQYIIEQRVNNEWVHAGTVFNGTEEAFIVTAGESMTLRVRTWQSARVSGSVTRTACNASANAPTSGTGFVTGCSH